MSIKEAWREPRLFSAGSQIILGSKKEIRACEQIPRAGALKGLLGCQ